MTIEPTSPAVLEPLWFDSQKHEIAKSPKVLQVEQLNVHRACALNAEWHSRFPIIKWGNVVRNKRSVCFHAHDGFVTYAVAIWSSPIASNRFKNGDSMLELRRMAIAEYAPRNTATFMLAKMRRWVFDNFDEIETLISYQDSEVHYGTIYKADNWVNTSISQTTEWAVNGRNRASAQSTAPKMRWEYKREKQK
jgi:hypothetical protein